MTKQEEIQQYLERDRTFQTGMVLLSKYCRNVPYLIHLNTKGESAETLRKVHYELAKIAGISEIKLRAIISKPIEIIPEKIEEKAALVPETVVKTIKLRQEFPFLSSADCPNELKILVSDMITSYETYQKLHPRILTAETEEEIEKTSELVVENFIENREIWDELNHYKTTGEVLGLHKIFKYEKLKKEYLELSAQKLSTAKSTLKSNISRNVKTLEELNKETEKNLPKIEEVNEKLQDYRDRLVIVEELLSQK